MFDVGPPEPVLIVVVIALSPTGHVPGSCARSARTLTGRPWPGSERPDMPRSGYCRDAPRLGPDWMIDMSSEQEAAGEAWAQGAANELESNGFATVDLDDLLHDPPLLAVQAAMECLQSAVTTVRRIGADADGMVAVPLAVSSSLTHESHSTVDVLTQPWEYGPGRQVPGLHLLSPAHWRLYEPVEKYLRDLGSQGLPDGYVAYYRTWRSEADAAKG